MPPTDTKRSRALIVRLVLWYDALRVLLPTAGILVASQLLGPPADLVVP
ncbi:MAG: hypothetical protein KY447_02185 [Actinobacteria bacterium]|nr:hypothetical protein [Actinomycetota bacterium]MBW3641700.1 hypothetical protein [Actinomycetota bacterium]